MVIFQPEEVQTRRLPVVEISDAFLAVLLAVGVAGIVHARNSYGLSCAASTFVVYGGYAALITSSPPSWASVKAAVQRPPMMWATLVPLLCLIALELARGDYRVHANVQCLTTPEGLGVLIQMLAWVGLMEELMFRVALLPLVVESSGARE